MAPSVDHHYGGLGYSGLANQNILIIINQSIQMINKIKSAIVLLVCRKQLVISEKHVYRVVANIKT